MKVFISWSGQRSQQLAKALNLWIHDVIQSVDCFASTDDIRSGQRWNNEINTQLSSTDFGILCVTPENVKSPWLNFEAGALAKRIEDDARVVPVTLGFSPSSLDEPLKQFNGVTADRPGITRLMQDIAVAAGVAIDVERAVERWWSDLESLIAEIPDQEVEVDAPEPPDVSEMFTDIMASLRGLSSDLHGLRMRPHSQRSVAEIRALVELLDQFPDIRKDIERGHPGAARYLEREAQRMAADRRYRIHREESPVPPVADLSGGEDPVEEAKSENGDV